MRKQIMILLTAVCLALALTPSPLAAQDTCRVPVFPPSDISGRGYPTVNGQLYDTGCYGSITVRAEVWITQTSTPWCLDGSRRYDRACAADAPDWVEATAQMQGYGWFDGYLRPIWRDSTDNSWHLLPDEHVDLYAGPPFIRGGEEEMGCSVDEVWDWQTGQCVPYNSPILIPLTQKQAVTLTALEAGVVFDLDGDGDTEQVSWTTGDSGVAFLALDRNGNGVIDDGSELFGNHTVPGASNGFIALDQINTQMGGTPSFGVDSTDPLFAQLLLWEDRNHDGVSQPDELQPASNVISAVSLGYQEHQRRDGHGNLFRYRGAAYVLVPGRAASPSDPVEANARRIVIYDVFFRQQQ